MGRGGDPEDATDAGCAAGSRKAVSDAGDFYPRPTGCPPFASLVVALDDPSDLGEPGEGEEDLAVTRLVGRADAEALPRLRTDPAA